jgi:glyoxylase-like metal-dependent hydrolase (beta-lactamase superfamily II)
MRRLEPPKRVPARFEVVSPRRERPCLGHQGPSVALLQPESQQGGIMESTIAKPRVETFFDEATATLSHIVCDPESSACAIVDPVLDFDPKSGRTSSASARRLIDYMDANALSVEWILETHIHADHLSSAAFLKREVGGRIGIGAKVREVQETFGKLFNAGPDFDPDGRQFDHLFQEDEEFRIGGLPARAIETPGHTPACVSYLIGDALFVGDTIFMPDFGSARCDFPGGNARTLYRSVRKLFALPAETRMFMCHDYRPGGRELRWETTVAEQCASNKHLRDGIDEDAFVEMRAARDRELDMPALILPSVQVNMRAGAFPPPESNGLRYLKIPLDAL